MYKKHIHIVFFLLTAIFSKKSFSQSYSDVFGKDSLPVLSLTGSTFTYNPMFNCIYHHSDENDKKNENKLKYLIDKEPDGKNYQKYYQLACSFWNLEKINQAEKMFLKIISSNEKHYCSTYYNGSDVPGDTSTNIYGYGSVTSHYKNEVALYLTKIYIEKKEFSKALSYLELAVNKYKTSYSCGTGYHRQKEEYDFLYAKCYEGLGENRKLLKLLLSECLERNDTMITHAIKQLY